MSFFSEPLNGIVRTEMEFFLNEPAFIPSVNIPFQNELRAPPLRKVLASLGQPIKPGPQGGTIPYANFVRFELGYDRFFFFRPLNPTNSFTWWVTAYVGQWNVTESLTGQNFRFNGQQKPTSTGVRTGANTQGLTLATISKLHTVDTDFVDLYPYESFIQSHLETTYLHGRLTPGITMIAASTARTPCRSISPIATPTRSCSISSTSPSAAPSRSRPASSATAPSSRRGSPFCSTESSPGKREALRLRPEAIALGVSLGQPPRSRAKQCRRRPARAGDPRGERRCW